MPLDAVLTSAQPMTHELVSLNRRLAEIVAERVPLQSAFDELSPPVMQLQMLIAQHRSGMQQLRAEADDDNYTGQLLELRRIEQEIDALRSVADLSAFRAAADALQAKNEEMVILVERQRELVLLAAAEAVERYLERIVIPIFASAGRARGVADLLGRAIGARAFGSNPLPAAAHIGARILEKVADTLASIRVPGDRAAAEDFLARLARDPTLDLELPDGPVDYHLAPSELIQPLPGSAFFSDANKAPGVPSRRDPFLDVHFEALRASSEHLNLPDLEADGWSSPFMPAPQP